MPEKGRGERTGRREGAQPSERKTAERSHRVVHKAPAICMPPQSFASWQASLAGLEERAVADSAARDDDDADEYDSGADIHAPFAIEAPINRRLVLASVEQPWLLEVDALVVSNNEGLRERSGITGEVFAAAGPAFAVCRPYAARRSPARGRSTCRRASTGSTAASAASSPTASSTRPALTRARAPPTSCPQTSFRRASSSCLACHAASASLAWTRARASSAQTCALGRPRRGMT